MNIQQTAVVLTKIQVGDNREVNQLVIREWHDTIGFLDQQDCVEAVTVHRRESTAYLQPAHIIAIVRRLKNERADRQLHDERVNTVSVSHPKPVNYEALSAAWNNPVEWAKQEAIYHDQLRVAGFDPHKQEPWMKNPMVCHSCMTQMQGES